MDLVVHYNRQYRIPFDRSISEHRLPDHSFPRDFSTNKGHRDYQLRKETINSYHQGIIYVHWLFAAADDNVINNLSFTLFSHMFFISFSYRSDSHNNSSNVEFGDKAKDLRINQRANADTGKENDVKIKSEIQLLQRR
jgi:hypothetical protein